MAARAPLWVIQKNLGNGAGYKQLSDALKLANIEFKAINIIPFSDEYESVDWDGAIIAYGSVRFVTNVHEKAEWIPGVFFDHKLFSMGKYMEFYGEHMLNANGKLLTIAEFSKIDAAVDELFYIRPQKDLKEFEARVKTFGELNEWFDVICAGDFELKASTPILVNEPIRILAEWRCFIVDGEYCSGSQYMKNGVVDITANVPNDVIEFSNELAKIWAPKAVFALDIGMTENGLKAIEINCFNSSGFYASDVGKIVKSVSEL